METIKPISKAPGHFVSVSGEIFYLSTKGYLLKKSLYTSKKGYIQFSFIREGKMTSLSVHRAVMMAHLPIENMESLEVNHINLVKSDNSLNNLEWSTRKENAAHAAKNKAYFSGKRHWKYRKNPYSHEHIFLMREKGLMQKQIAKVLGISTRTIIRVLNNKR